MKNKQNNKENEYLSKIIPNLDRFSFLCGTEGKVYFVDEDFVVKTYFEPIENLVVFNEFCKEIKNFGDSGYSVPRIYDWTAEPLNDGNGFQTYILQERIKGKKLFDLDITRLYDVCKKFCSIPEFDFAIESKKNNPELLGLILREHILDFLRTNRKLNSLSDSEIENFISTNYNLGLGARYSWPDVQAANVMFDGKKLTIIDNAYLGHNVGAYSEDYVKAHLLRDMFLLFYYNENITNMPKFKSIVSEELKKLRQENSEECFLAMRRFVRKANEMYRPVITNSYDYDACKMVAYEVFDKQKADEICAEVQRDV